MLTKAELRRRARRLAPATEGESALVVGHLAALLEEWQGCALLTYLAMPGEVDLHGLVELTSGCRWLVTRTPGRGWLTVHALEAPRERHPLGFEQPAEGEPPVDPGEVDVALVPGLLFDSRGFRLGRGLGYYDQLLARLRPDADTVGVTLDRFVVTELPHQEHDVAVRRLVTESGVRLVAPT